MRSKEVEKAIKNINEDKKIWITDFHYREITSCKVKDIETVLAYIEELENARSPYFIPKAIIQITIEKYKNKIQELYKKDLWVDPDYTILKLKYENYIEVLEELLKGGKKNNGKI